MSTHTIAATEPTATEYAVEYLLIDGAVVAVAQGTLKSTLHEFPGHYLGFTRHGGRVPVTEAQRRKAAPAVMSQFAALDDELHYRLNRAPWPRFGDDI